MGAVSTQQSPRGRVLRSLVIAWAIASLAGLVAALSALDSYASMVQQDRVATSPLRERALEKGYFWRPVPELSRDVHDLDGLARIADLVFETSREERAVGS